MLCLAVTVGNAAGQAGTAAPTTAMAPAAAQQATLNGTLSQQELLTFCVPMWQPLVSGLRGRLGVVGCCDGEHYQAGERGWWECRLSATPPPAPHPCCHAALPAPCPCQSICNPYQPSQNFTGYDVELVRSAGGCCSRLKLAQLCPCSTAARAASRVQARQPRRFGCGAAGRSRCLASCIVLGCAGVHVPAADEPARTSAVAASLLVGVILHPCCAPVPCS